MKNQIKLFDPSIDSKEIQISEKILKSKFWASGSGNGYVKKFEDKFQNYVHSKDCIAVNSGTAALHLALSLFDLKNKEVILPSLSFVSTAHAIIYNGAKPVFVDVEPKTLCIDPLAIDKSITKKTKLILPVHFGGMSCDLKQISEICSRNNISLVEDAAHAAGTKYNGGMIGSQSEAVCFSFHPVKNLAMPTGGAITLNGTSTRCVSSARSPTFLTIVVVDDSLGGVSIVRGNFDSSSSSTIKTSSTNVNRLSIRLRVASSMPFGSCNELSR